MCKVTVINEDNITRTCAVIGQETPQQIIRYFGWFSETKAIYMNGSLLSKEQLTIPIPKLDKIFLSIRPTATRG
jgi:hypothetical protein